MIGLRVKAPSYHAILGPRDTDTDFELNIHDVQIAMSNSLGMVGSRAFDVVRQIAIDGAWKVYLVGGPVRDFILGQDINDLDLGIEGNALSFSRLIARELEGEVIDHPQFMTTSVIAPDIKIDLATSRKETYPGDGILPQVVPGSVSDDLARRDFSINAMAIPLWEEHPKLLDPYGGLIDLNARLIRVLHGKSFNEDPTRMFRAIKYESRLGFSISSDSLSMMFSAVDNGVMSMVSGERIRKELEQIFSEPTALGIISRSQALGLIKAVHKTWMNSPFQFEELEELKDELHHDPMSGLVAICWDLPDTDPELLITRLSMSRIWADVVRDTVRLRSLESKLSSENIPCSLIYSLLDSMSYSVLRTAKILTDNSVFAARLGLFTDTLMSVSPFLSGDDLISLGVPEGPKIGRILGLLREQKLDGKITTEIDELNFVSFYLESSSGSG